MIGDLFHFGHLEHLRKAKQKSDIHVCGVITDAAADRWLSPLICNYKERSKVIEQTRYVDYIMQQDSLDPSDNLEKIIKKYPDYKIMFYPMFQKWNFMPASKIVREHGGNIIKSGFYEKLSRENIKNAFIESSTYNSIDDSTANRFENKLNINSSKAETLQNLSRKLKESYIEKLYVFTIKEWVKSNKKILAKSKDIFGSKKVIVRSSSLSEDGFNTSKAGMYHSELNVDNSNVSLLKNAINKVKESYKKGKSNSLDQIIIQEQSDNIILSGVCLTRNLKNNAPYYVINFDDKSSDTSSVTSGLVGDKVEIIRNIDQKKLNKKWRSLIKAIREIEKLVPDVALDIEFGINKQKKIIIFQVRPLAANSKFPAHNDSIIFSLHKKLISDYLKYSENNDAKENLLSDMGFWNPAELIGNRSSNISVSLFSDILMNNIWNSSLLSLGYSKCNGNLLKVIGNKGYIDIEKSFSTLVPSLFSGDLRKKLVKYYINKLKRKPEYHDKLEFEIILDIYNFTSDDRLIELANNDFTREEISLVKNKLISHTKNILHNYKNIFKKDDNSIKNLLRKYVRNVELNLSYKEIIKKMFFNLSLIKKFGTPQFCRAARLAFISKSILKSFSDKYPEHKKESDHLLSCIKTISSKMQHEIQRIKNNSDKDKFFRKYGHLRPDTYNLLKERYDHIPDIISFNNNLRPETSSSYKVSKNMIKKFNTFFYENDINLSYKEFLQFLKTSIQNRELYKFQYTKVISDTMEMISKIGEKLGIKKEDLVNVDLELLSLLSSEKTNDQMSEEILSSILKSRRFYNETINQISLPSLIFSNDDLFTVSNYTIVPNFITMERIKGDVLISPKDPNVSLKDKIIVIENADPGYDWIFTHNIKGLITQYGGLASHMAIRCAEFNIPAAIGCGKIIYDRVLSSKKITLDCHNMRIEKIK